MKKRKIIFWCLYSSFIASFAYGDRIYLKSGEIIEKVRVKEDGVQRVIYQKGGRRYQVRSEEVERIDFQNAPRALQEGMRKFKKYLFREAIRSLEKVRYARFKPYAKFYIAESYRLLGEFKKAIKTYKEVLEGKAFRLTPIAQYQMGMVYIYDGNPISARRVFRDMVEKSYPKYWKLMGYYGLGMAQLRRKRTSQALEAFSRVIQSIEKMPAKEKKKFSRLYQLARKGKGLVYVEEKSYEKAKEILQSLLKESSDEEVLAGCYIGLGRIYYRKAEERKQDPKNNYRRALLAFLRVSTLYPRFKLLYGEALYFAAQCYRKIGEEKLAKYLEEEIKLRVPRWARYK